MVPKDDLTTLPKYDEMVTHPGQVSSNDTQPKNVVRTVRRLAARPELIDTRHRTKDRSSSTVANAPPRAKGRQSKSSPCCQTPGKGPSNSPIKRAWFPHLPAPAGVSPRDVLTKPYRGAGHRY
jgi:hypothetical protein